jgi:hypothetical protein
MYPLGLGASETPAKSSQLEDSGGLSTFGDSLPTEALFVEESRLMSWGTLHKVHEL